MSTLQLSLNAVLPILIILLLGLFLKHKNIINSSFSNTATNLAFSVCFPASLFNQISSIETGNALSLRFAIYLVLIMIIPPIILMIVVPKYIKNPARCGAFIQGAFRTNPVLMGTMIMKSLFPDDQLSPFFLSFIITVPFSNILSSITFSIFSSKSEKIDPLSILRDAVMNPIIIGVLLGLIVNWLKIPILPPIKTVINHLAGTATPLALLSIGAQLTISQLKNDKKHLYYCLLIKMLLLPTIGVIPMFLLGFSNIEILTVFFILGTPGAVTGYAMSRRMKSDYVFTGEILSISSLTYCFTSGIAIYLFKVFGVF